MQHPKLNTQMKQAFFDSLVKTGGRKTQLSSKVYYALQRQLNK